MEQKIMEVMRRMQDILSEEQLRELQSALRVTFDGCELQPRSELMVMDDSWQGDLEDFLMSKALEGKSKRQPSDTGMNWKDCCHTSTRQ